MKVEALNQITAQQARELYAKYQGHCAGYTAADREIAEMYKRIGAGKTVIRALASIVAAGMNEKGLPKLAIMRADQPRAYWHPDGATPHFSPAYWDRSNGRGPGLHGKRIPLSWPGCPYPADRHRTFEAIVPLIPVHLRPKRGLANYHILWEAEWARSYPVDPYLLRRFGGDAWIVVAAWDLTDVERAVMSERLNH